MDAIVANVVHIIVVYCALHNICEAKGEYFQSEWAQSRYGFQSLYRQLDPSHMHTALVPTRQGKFVMLFARISWSSGEPESHFGLCQRTQHDMMLLEKLKGPLPCGCVAIYFGGFWALATNVNEPTESRQLCEESPATRLTSLALVLCCRGCICTLSPVWHNVFVIC